MLKLLRFADGSRDHALIKLALQFMIFAFWCASAFGQTAQLRGQVFDQSGAVVPSSAWWNWRIQGASGTKDAAGCFGLFQKAAAPPMFSGGTVVALPVLGHL